MLVLNSIEIVYGYKLFDYFDFCDYRNKLRENKPNVFHDLDLDRSISIEHRSMDNMLYTHNYYFKGSIVIYGVYGVMIGVTIIIQNNFGAYSDPVLLF